MDGTGLLFAPLLAALRDLGACVNPPNEAPASTSTAAQTDTQSDTQTATATGTQIATPLRAAPGAAATPTPAPAPTEALALHHVQVSVLPHPGDQLPSDAQLQVSLHHRLKIGGRLVILAESFSGPWAMRLLHRWPAALDAPVGLVMACSFVRNPQRWAGPIRTVARALPPVQPAGPVLRVVERALYGRAPAPALCTALHASLAQVQPAVMKARLHAVLASDETRAWQALRLPTLVLSALQDDLVPQAETRRMLRLRPDCQQVALPGPHGLLQAEPVATARAMAQFLQALG